MRGHRATTKTAELWAPVSSAADPPPSSQLISWFVFYLSLSSNKSESLAYMINNSKVTEYSDVQILYVMLFIIILCACENYNAVCLATVIGKRNIFIPCSLSICALSAFQTNTHTTTDLLFTTIETARAGYFTSQRYSALRTVDITASRMRLFFWAWKSDIFVRYLRATPSMDKA